IEVSRTLREALPCTALCLGLQISLSHSRCIQQVLSYALPNILGWTVEISSIHIFPSPSHTYLFIYL
uniref:Uncharacterized protein n=1 Tax=Cyprinus carpio TaxID=7962 RepID=A0A8C1VQ21_CYPCA